MSEQGFELEISEETAHKVSEYAKKTNLTEDQVIEYILREFIQNQLHIIEKRAADVNEPVGKLIDMQFARILEYLNSQPNPVKL